MKIINQTSNNECGICCINMIINHFYHSQKDRKHEIYSLVDNLEKNGLNIFEMEDILDHYKIETNSYECEWEEIFNFDKPLILVVKNGEVFHYIVGKIKNQYLYTYDPLGSKKKFTKEIKMTNFTGYVISTNFYKQKIKPININLKLIKNISIGMNLIFIFINIFQFIFSILLSYFLSKLMNLNYANTFEESLWKFSFIYVGLLLISELFAYIEKLVKNYYFLRVYPKSINLFWKTINRHNLKFFNNYSKHELLQIYGYVHKIINFYSFFGSQIFSESIIYIFSIIIGSIINKNNLLFFLIIAILNLFIMFINTRFDKRIINFNIKSNPVFEKNVLDFFEYKKTNYCNLKDKNIAKELQMKINSVLFKTIEVQNNKSILDLFDKVINLLIQYVIIIITIKYSNNFGLIFLNMNIINLYSQSLKNILEFWKEFLNNQIIIEIVKKIYSQNSAHKKPKYEIEKIKNIECGSTIFNKNICINKNDLTNFEFIKNLINLNDPQNNIKINNIYLKDLKSLDFLHKKIIYITPKSNLIQIHNHSISLNILEILDQLESEEINIYATLLELEKHKNKIIIINENFNNIKNQFLLNEIKKILININQNNFLISNNSNNFLMDIYENFI
ncbi:MAG: hypothetical protein H9897_02315 [Candidatus Ureaplasma intestinipullorum]|uniref:Uncharacterized protein n=1 Tax=Candidatus Ureaplasma intestinipullorum TaxID=2838770 RepID=A0A9E2KVJ1_9BACT|nr:hypothetical protein [Candidatus Ureaplasma intestinipullorum]